MNVASPFLLHAVTAAASIVANVIFSKRIIAPIGHKGARPLLYFAAKLLGPSQNKRVAN